MPFDVIYQIGTRSGQVLYRFAARAAGGTRRRTGSGVRQRRARRTQSESVVPDFGHWDRLIIRMAKPLGYRDALLSRTLRAVALPLLFALVLLTVLIALVTERAFRPVRRIAAELAGRGPHDLSPVNTAEMPVETHALGVALNGLLARQAEVLARERRFTADAAHELRTPLAALRVQAQVAARAGTAAETRTALDKLQANIDRATHLMSQLLSLARLEPGSSYIPGEATEAASRSIADGTWRKLPARQAGRDHGRRCHHQPPGSPESCIQLLRNLLENYP
jgi:signal transduction histidine kinase